ncbi:MAG: TolC family outer membrane protein [Formivibrio sp.]|nr:TolC family outer membrane protein [Formivibrio sp.]
MKKTLLAASLLFAAQTVFADDLITAWTAAQKADATYRAAYNGLLAGQENVVQGRALLLPEVTLSGNATRSHVDFNSGNEAGKYPSSLQSGNSAGYTLSLTQPIYRIEALAGYDQQKLQTALAKIQYKTAEQDLIQRVATAYFDVALAEEKIRQINAQKDAVSQQLAQAKKSFEVGVSTITDVDSAQASFDTLLAQEIVAQNDREIKYQAYEQLTGLNPQSVAQVNDHIVPSLPQPADVNAWISRAEATNYSLLSQRLNQSIAQREIDKYRAETAPSVDLVASYGDKHDASGISKSGGNDVTKTAQIGILLSIPLYTGGNRSSQYRQAIAKNEQQRDLVEASRRSAVLSTRQAFLGMQNGVAQVKALTQSLNSSKSLLDSTTLGKEVGVRTIVDVLNAQQQYYSTRYDLTAARYSYLINRLQLAAAVGALGEQDLLETNNLLLAK